jgi:hypothetical protein
MSEAGIMPIPYRLLQTTLGQGMRILYKLDSKNTLRNETISPPQGTPLGKLKSLLAERHAFRPAVEVCLSGPPWERRPGPDIETAKEWNRIIDLRKEVKKYTIELWQANYSSGVESGKIYRQMVKEAKCKLRMFDVMQTWPRYVLSKLVQFRTGHALVGGWFKDRGIQKDEGYNCGCGQLETINHTIKQYPKREKERKKTKGSVPGSCVANFIEYQTRPPSNGGVCYNWRPT